MALDKDTMVLKYSGAVVPLHTLKPGDLLMGDQSKPVRITSLAPIETTAIEIRPPRSKAILASGDQVLVLRKSKYLNEERGYKAKYTSYPDILSITVGDLQRRGRHLQRSFLLYQAEVDFPEKEVPMDSYFLGIWLGDGHSHTVGITTMDEEVRKEIYSQAVKWIMNVTRHSKANNRATTYIITKGNVSGHSRKKNPLLNALRKLNLIRNKHIPHLYFKNSKAVRLQLLAGLVDTDGYFTHNYYSITQKNKRMAEQICLLANSLGFRSVLRTTTKRIKRLGFKGTYYTISISGAINTLPVRIPRKIPTKISMKYDRRASGYKLNPAGTRQLITVRTEKDNNFLLGDCTIMAPKRAVPSSLEYEKERLNSRWRANFDKFKKFVTKHKRFPGRNAKGDELTLYNWKNNSLERIRKVKNTPERLQALQSLGIPFNYRQENFDRMYNLLITYRKQNPEQWPVYQEEFPKGNRSLSEWCRTIRKAYSQGKLSEERFERLTKIGFQFPEIKKRGLTGLKSG